LTGVTLQGQTNMIKVWTEGEALQQALGVIQQECEYIFENDESFMKEFCKGNFWILNNIYFNDEYLKLHYILDCGQHIGDAVPIEDYFKWRDKND